MSVMLNVDRKFAAPNGNLQFCICVRAPTKKRVAEILAENRCGYASLRTLNEFHGLWVNESYKFDPPTDEEIYFQNEHSGTPHYGEWLRLKDHQTNV